MTQDMNTLEVLMKARALIAKGWCRRAYFDGKGRYCMRGAVHTAEGLVVPNPGLQWAFVAPESGAISALRRVIPGCRVVDFNDAPEQTHANILAAFDRAIEAEWEKVQGAAEPVVREQVPA